MVSHDATTAVNRTVNRRSGELMRSRGGLTRPARAPKVYRTRAGEPPKAIGGAQSGSAGVRVSPMARSTIPGSHALQRARRAWPTVAVYVALSTVFCWPLFAQPLANGHGDWDQHIFYYAAVLRNAAFGDLPFWNPWYCGGNVLWPNPQVSLVSPVYLLVLVMPLTLTMKLNVLAHYLIGCLGMHLVVRRIAGVKSTAAVVFLVSLFVFSGAITLHVRSGHTVYLPVLLLPLVVYCFWQAAAGKTRSLLLGGAILGFSILNGGMHVVPLAAVLLGVLGLGALVFGRRLRPMVLAGVMFTLACAFAAPRIVPAMAFIQSADFHDTRSVKEPDLMSVEMLRIAFWDASQGTHVKVPGVQQYGWHEYGNYMGWFGATLALASAGWILVFRLRREHWREASAALGLVVVVLLTAGEFAPYAPASLLRHVPLISSFRVFSRYTMLVPLLGAVCVAFAARVLETAWGGSAWRRLVEIVCVVGVCQIALANRAYFRDVFILPADTQSRLFERTTPIVAEREVLTPGGPRVHRTYMLDSMMAGVSPLNCYEPLQVSKVAWAGPVTIRGEGDVSISASTFSPNRVAATVVVGRDPARVVLNANFAEGWSTSAGPVERDPTSRQPSVVLPAGYAGTVAFTFVPPGLWMGLIICAIAVGISVVLWKTREA